MGKKLSVFLLFVIFISCSSKEVDTSPSNVITEATTSVTQDIEEVEDTTTTLLMSVPNQPQLDFIDVNIPGQAPETLQIIEANVMGDVSLRFISSESVEIHIHGIDLTLTIEANVDFLITFQPGFAGDFEVEVHGLGIQFARLIVSP